MRNLIKVLFIFSAFSASASDGEESEITTKKQKFSLENDLSDYVTDGEEDDSYSKNNSSNSLEDLNKTKNTSDRRAKEEKYNQSIRSLRVKNALKKKGMTRDFGTQINFKNLYESRIDLIESRVSHSTETSELKSILNAFEPKAKTLNISSNLYNEKIEGKNSEEIKKLNEELLEKDKEIENLTKKVNGLDNARTPLKEEIQKLKEELNKVIAENSHLIEEIRKQDVNRNSNDQKSHADSIEKEMLRKTITELRLKIKNLENDLEKNKDNSIRTVPPKTDFKKKSIAIPIELNPSAELEVSKSENKTISYKLSSLESELKMKNEELDTANIKNKELEKEAKQSNDEKIKLAQTVKEKDDENNMLKDKIEKLEIQNKKMAELEEVMKKEAEQLKNEKSELDKTVKEKDEEIEKLELENKKMMEEKNIGFFTKVKNGASKFFNYIFSIPKKVLSFF